MTDPGSLGGDLLSDPEIAGWEPSVSCTWCSETETRSRGVGG